MSATQNLKSLRDKPFELLRELERLARTALTGQGRDGSLLWRSWVYTDTRVEPSDTLYLMSWADTDGQWAFDAFGESQEDIDALVSAFVAAANP